MTEVLFVCTANVCRSPMAEVIFDALAADAGLPHRAQSAGTAALRGSPMAPRAVDALSEVGFRPGAHSARQITMEIMAGADIVLAMTPWHAATLTDLSNGSATVFTLPEYATGVASSEGVPDPYGLTMVAYRSSVRQLHEYLEQVVDRIARG